MTDAVAKLFQELGNLAWFANCGKRIPGDYLVAQSLKEAYKYYADPRGMSWENGKQAICNRQCSLLWDATHNIRAQQQQSARETAEATDEFFEKNRSQIFAIIPEDKYLGRMVKLDLRAIVSEVEDQIYGVEALRNLQFFSKMPLPVYLAGHMPCGWAGKRFPQR